MLPTRDPSQDKRLKVKGWKQIFQANGQEEKEKERGTQAGKNGNE